MEYKSEEVILVITNKYLISEFCNGRAPVEVGKCNTQECKRTHLPFPCVCSNKRDPFCKSSLCPPNWTCHLKQTGKHECEEDDSLICTARGDPHIRTFDKRKLDAYGVGQYILARHLTVPVGWSDFQVLMNTRPVRHVSVLTQIFIKFQMRNGEKIEIMMDERGKSEIFMNKRWYELSAQDGLEFTLFKARKFLILTTWFGLKITLKRSFVTIEMPSYFQQGTSGLCMDCNGKYDDDLRHRNGTVLIEDWTQIPSGLRSLTYAECLVVRSWLDGSAATKGCLPYGENGRPVELLEPESWGPECDETGIVLCHPEQALIAEQTCKDLLTAPWLLDCNELIDISETYDDCVTDYCMDSSNDTLVNILEQYLDECRPVLPACHDILINWPANSNLPEPECGTDQIWEPCVDICWNITRCFKNNFEDCGEFKPEPNCICAEGFVMSNGECILD